MKGLILSLAVFAAYVFVTAILSHGLRPKRPARLFFPTIFIFGLIYSAVYWFTPQNIYFLPTGWILTPVWLDALAGLMILTLNYISFIDWFFGFNGGFSMSLMLELLRTDNRGLTSEELIGRYTQKTAHTDKIFGWRLPRLEETGYITQDRRTGLFLLTSKGRLVAHLTFLSKRMLNLGAGG